MQKKSLVILFSFLLMISLFVMSSGIVVASDLDDCTNKCKLNLETEEERSPCIQECKELYGFEEDDRPDELRCLPCGDDCAPYDFVVVASCSPPTNGEPICGSENGECIVLDFEDDSHYRCEDMNKEDCEAAEGCESILGPSFCEGDVCIADMVWKGCKYKYDEVFDELKEEYEEEEVNPGITPDSPFYFLDDFFDRGDRAEKIAEVEAMIAKGDFESARKALLKYMEYAKEFEEDPDPEKRDEARRAAASIHRMLEKIKSEIPEEERKEFYEDILDIEGGIVTAVEISDKIRQLCTQLSELDPVEYSKMCRAGDDAPKWQKELDKDLSAEQEKTARKFVSIMKQCFSTSGQDCACEDIPFYDFSIACSKAAPLATACDIDGDEVACDNLDNLDMPDLPEWLEPIWEELESDMMEAQFDMHMPKECVEAGVTDPKECGKVMIKTHAPLECRAALLASGCDGERECRGICDKIMMEQYAPECAEKGITNPEECANFMDSFRGEFEEGRGPRDFGPDCMNIEDPMGRLDCYDNKGNEMGEHYGTDTRFEGQGELTWQCKENRIHWAPDCETFMREEWPELERQKMEEGDFRRENQEDWRVKEKECAASCDLENGWWDFRGGECVCYTDERSSEGFRDDFERSGDYEDFEGTNCDDCVSQCESRVGQRLRGTDCGPNGCECYYESDEPQYAEGEGPPYYPENDPSVSGYAGYDNYGDDYPSDYDDNDGSYDNSGEGSYSGGRDGDYESSDSDSNSGSSEGEGDSEGDGGTPITGGVVGTSENRFLSYWFKRIFQ